MNSRFKKILLLIGDALSLFLALALALIARRKGFDFNQEFKAHLGPFAPVFIFWLLILYISDLYDLNVRVKSRRFFRSFLSAAITAALFAIIYFYLNVSAGIAPKTNLALFSVFYFALFFIWRYLFQVINRAVSKTGLAIIGNNQKSSIIQEELKKNPGAGYQLDFIAASEESLSELKSKVESGKIKVVVVCENFNSAGSANILLNLLQHRISVFDYADFYEILCGKVPVEALSADWFLENLKENQKNYFNYFKRTTDIILSLAALALSLIFWPLIALIIKLESKGPVFIRQERLGRRGIKFILIKFRTMKEEGNDRTITLENDKRITKFGNFLRKTRIDEIPQMINVLKGEMSFIGPRPERPEISEKLEAEIPLYATRLIVKPGMSGWDQVSGEYHSPTKEDTIKKLQNDLFYIKNRSLFLDAVIILKTIGTMLSRKGR